MLEAAALKYRRPLPEAGSADLRQLVAAAGTLCPHLNSDAAFFAALKFWPGVPDLLACVTASFPAKPAAGPPPEKGARAEERQPHASPSRGSASPPLAGQLEAMLPRAVGVPAGVEERGLLLLAEHTRLMLASLLPAAQREEWRLLFNSDVHGKSYASFAGAVMEAGPTVLVVRPPHHPVAALRLLCGCDWLCACVNGDDVSDASGPCHAAGFFVLVATCALKSRACAAGAMLERNARHSRGAGTR